MRFARARPASRCRATRRAWSTPTVARCRPTPSAASRCAGRPAAAISPTSASANTCRTAGTSPATPTSMDADGYFWYQARSDDMIVSAGYNIAGPEVEVGAARPSRGRRMRRGRRARRGARPDRQGLCGAAAGLQRRHGARPRLLQEHVKATIAPYKYPRAIEYVTALPRTQTGKLQRFELRRMAGDAASHKLAS